MVKDVGNLLMTFDDSCWISPFLQRVLHIVEHTLLEDGSWSDVLRNVEMGLLGCEPVRSTRSSIKFQNSCYHWRSTASVPSPVFLKISLDRVRAIPDWLAEVSTPFFEINWLTGLHLLPVPAPFCETFEASKMAAAKRASSSLRLLWRSLVMVIEQ